MQELTNKEARIVSDPNPELGDKGAVLYKTLARKTIRIKGEPYITEVTRLYLRPC